MPPESGRLYHRNKVRGGRDKQYDTYKNEQIAEETFLVQLRYQFLLEENKQESRTGN